MKHVRLVVVWLPLSAVVLAFVGVTLGAASSQQLAAHKVTVQINGLPRQCSVTAWEYFTLPPNGHQPWRFTMHYGAGTSCAGGGGLKFLAVEVDQKVGGHWRIVDRPVTKRIAQPTHRNPLRISTSWTALPSTPRATAKNQVKYRVKAKAIISFAKHPCIPPRIVNGVTWYGTAFTPATTP